MDEQARRRRRAEARRRVRRQRALVAVSGVGLILVTVVLGFVLGGSGSARGPRQPAGSGVNAGHRAVRPVELPEGGREILPVHRVVAFYGAPGDRRLGVLGTGAPTRIARALKRQSKAYASAGRSVLPALELITTVATSSPGADGLYRARQSAAVVRAYLKAARRARELLILDLQPGRSDFLTEARVYEPFLREPDVSLALDPEWQLAPGQTPAQQIGSTDAAAINRVSAYLAAIVASGRLPQKLLIVHQFTNDMIRQRDQILPRAGLAITVNVDGFGDPPNKIARYRALSDLRPGLYHGFKLFYTQDIRLMTPEQVLRLRPRPSLIVYQ
jgi:hypothetical protein